LFYLTQKEKYGNFTDDMLKYQVVVSLFSALVEVGESAGKFYILQLKHNPTGVLQKQPTCGIAFRERFFQIKY
jgi:hypothetical protein